MIHVKWYSKCMTSSYLCTETCSMKTCVNVCLIFCFEKDCERKQKQMRSCMSVVGKYYVRDLMQVFNVHSGLQIYSQKFLRVLKFLHPCWRCRCWIFWMNSWSFGVDYIKDWWTCFSLYALISLAIVYYNTTLKPLLQLKPMTLIVQLQCCALLGNLGFWHLCGLDVIFDMYLPKRWKTRHVSWQWRSQMATASPIGTLAPHHTTKNSSRTILGMRQRAQGFDPASKLPDPSTIKHLQDAQNKPASLRLHSETSRRQMIHF